MPDFLRAVNDTKGVVLATRVTAATSLGSRSRGLLGRASLPADEGLWINPCRSVHTFFMRFPIDVLFLDPQNIAVARATLVPWRLSHWVWSAGSVLELPAGTLARTRTESGDRIVF